MLYRLTVFALTLCLVITWLSFTCSYAKLITVKGGCYDVEHLETFQIYSEAQNEAVVELIRTKRLSYCGVDGYVQNGQIYFSDGTPSTWRPPHFVDFPTSALGFLVVRENGEWDYKAFNELPTTMFVCTDHGSDDNSSSSSSSSSSTITTSSSASPSETSTTTTTTAPPEPYSSVNLTHLLYNLHKEFNSFFPQIVEVAAFTTNALVVPLPPSLASQFQQGIDQGHMLSICFDNNINTEVNSQCNQGSSASLALSRLNNGTNTLNFVIPFNVISNENEKNEKKVYYKEYTTFLVAYNASARNKNNFINMLNMTEKADNVMILLSSQLRVYSLAYVLQNMHGSIQVSTADLAAKDVRIKSVPLLRKGNNGNNNNSNNNNTITVNSAMFTSHIALTAWRGLSFTMINNGNIGHTCVPAPSLSAKIPYVITGTHIQLMISAHTLQRVRNGKHSLCASWAHINVVVASFEQRNTWATTPLRAIFTYNSVIPVTIHNVPLMTIAHGEYRGFIAPTSACSSGQSITLEVVNDYRFIPSSSSLLELNPTNVNTSISHSSPHILLTAQLPLESEQQGAKHVLLYPKQYVCLQHTTSGHVLPVTYEGTPVTVEGDGSSSSSSSSLSSKSLLPVTPFLAWASAQNWQQRNSRTSSRILIILTEMQGYVNLSSYVEPAIVGDANDEANYEFVMSLLDSFQKKPQALVNTNNINNSNNNYYYEYDNDSNSEFVQSQQDAHQPFVRIVPFQWSKSTTVSSPSHFSTLSMQLALQHACLYNKEEMTLPITNGSLLRVKRPIYLSVAEEGILCVDEVYLRIRYIVRDAKKQISSIAGLSSASSTTTKTAAAEINLIDESTQSYASSIEFSKTELQSMDLFAILLAPIMEEEYLEEEESNLRSRYYGNVRSSVDVCGGMTSDYDNNNSKNNNNNNSMNYIIAPLRFVSSTIAFFALPHLSDAINSVTTYESSSSPLPSSPPPSSLRYRVCIGVHHASTHTSYFTPLLEQINLYTFDAGLHEWKRRAGLDESVWTPCDANGICGAANEAYAVRVCKSVASQSGVPSSATLQDSATNSINTVHENMVGYLYSTQLPRWTALFESTLREMGALQIRMNGNTEVVKAALFDEYYDDIYFADDERHANNNNNNDKDDADLAAISEPHLYIRLTDALPHCQQLKLLPMSTEPNSNDNHSVVATHFAVATLQEPRIFFTSALPSSGVMLSLIPWEASCHSTNFVLTTLTTTVAASAAINVSDEQIQTVTFATKEKTLHEIENDNKYLINTQSATNNDIDSNSMVMIDLMHMYELHRYGYFALCYWPYVNADKSGNWFRVSQTGIHVVSEVQTQVNNHQMLVDGIVSTHSSGDLFNIELWETQVTRWYLVGMFGKHSYNSNTTTINNDDNNSSKLFFHLIDRAASCEEITTSNEIADNLRAAMSYTQSEKSMYNSRIHFTASVQPISLTRAIVEIDADEIFTIANKLDTNVQNHTLLEQKLALESDAPEMAEYTACFSTTGNTHLHSLAFEQMQQRWIVKRNLTLTSINFLPYFAVSSTSIANINNPNDNDNDDDNSVVDNGELFTRLQITDPHHPPITALRFFVANEPNIETINDNDHIDRHTNSEVVDCDVSSENYVTTLLVQESSTHTRWCDFPYSVAQRFADIDNVTLRVCATAADISDHHYKYMSLYKERISLLELSSSSLLETSHDAKNMARQVAPHFQPVSAYVIVTRQTPESVLNYIALLLHVVSLNSSTDILSINAASITIQTYVTQLIPQVHVKQILITNVDVNTFSLYIQPAITSLSAQEKQISLVVQNNVSTHYKDKNINNNDENNIDWEKNKNVSDNWNKLSNVTREIYRLFQKGVHLPLYFSNSEQNTSMFVLSTVYGVDVRRGVVLTDLPLINLITQGTNEMASTDAVSMSIRLFCVVIVPTALGFVGFSIQRSIPTLSHKDVNARNKLQHSHDDATNNVTIQNNRSSTNGNNHNAKSIHSEFSPLAQSPLSYHEHPAEYNTNGKLNAQHEKLVPELVNRISTKLSLSEPDNTQKQEQSYSSPSLETESSSLPMSPLTLDSTNNAVNVNNKFEHTKHNSNHNNTNNRNNNEYEEGEENEDEDEDEDEDMKMAAPPQLACTAPSTNVNVIDVLTHFTHLPVENTAKSPLYLPLSDSHESIMRDTKDENDSDSNNNINNNIQSNNYKNKEEWSKKTSKNSKSFAALAASPPVHNVTFAMQREELNSSQSSI